METGRQGTLSSIEYFLQVLRSLGICLYKEKYHP